MKKISSLVILLVWLGSGVNLFSCERDGRKRNSRRQDTNASAPLRTPANEGATVPSNGKIKELAAGNRSSIFATILFELQSSGGQQPRQLRDAASGVVDASGRVNLSSVDAFALTGALQSPFRVTRQFTENEQNLDLRFETIAAPNISDNFSATASLKAVATGVSGAIQFRAHPQRQPLFAGAIIAPYFWTAAAPGRFWKGLRLANTKRRRAAALK